MRIYIIYVYEYIDTYLYIQTCNAYIFAYLFYVVYVIFQEIYVKIYVTLKCECMYTRRFTAIYTYGVATISRLLKTIRLFCKIALQKRPIFYKRDLQFEGAY